MTDFAAYADPHHISEWCQDDGPVLWWRLPVEEPPYAGTPLDDDWPGRHTHWTRPVLPRMPFIPLPALPPLPAPIPERMAYYMSPCPYCGTICECDLVDVGVGFIQCGPYYCDRCGASEIGPHDNNLTTACERLFGWYGPGRPPGSSANVIAGRVVSHEAMRDAYRTEFINNPAWENKEYVEEWYRRVRKEGI